MKPQCFIIVDDDPYNNILCKYIIEEVVPEAEVFDFTNAKKCIEYCQLAYKKGKQNLPAIILLDMNMPQMNGWEFLEWFEKTPDFIKDHLRIYILSSTVNPKDKEKANLNPNIKGFFTKPLETETVENIIEDVRS